MRLHLTPRPLVHLITTILLAPSFTTAVQLGRRGNQGALAFNQLFERDCSGELCGWNNQLCCESGSQCYTDSNDQAQCSTAGAVAGGGYYSVYTTTFIETDFQTITSTLSSYIAGTTATATAQCNYALNESPCGDICCASNQYCYVLGQCRDAGNGGSSGYYSSYTAGAPIAPTSSYLTTATETESPTTTVPFLPPVATGANVTQIPQEESGGGSGLSGGAIAGIVIGVLAGLLLLGLICFYCCLRGLFEGCLALFGLGGRRKRRVTETDVYERRSHYSGGGGGGRTWYGTAARPARAEKKDHTERNRVLGIGAGLAGLAAILGMKRRHDRREEEKQSDYSYYSDYYTSSSSASSDDRRTRQTGRSYSRSRR